jgi:hypothetical protein
MSSRSSEDYKSWSTEQLERAVGQSRDQYDAITVEAMAEELAGRRVSEAWMCLKCGLVNPAGTTICACESDPPIEALPLTPSSASTEPLGPDERACPDCGEITRRNALECPVCGKALIENVETARQEYVEGSLFGAALSPESVLQITDEIKSLAKRGMWFSVVGFIIIFSALVLTGGRVPLLPFFIPIILTPLGILFSVRALRRLAEHPECNRLSSARGMALTGLIVGLILAGLYTLLIVNTMRRF